MKRILFNFALLIFLGVMLIEYKGKQLVALPFVQGISQSFLDWQLEKHSPDLGAAGDEVVIIDVDEDSLQQFGRWPWRRDRLAELVNQLFEVNQVAVAAFVMPFSEPDVIGQEIMDELKKTFIHDPAMESALYRIEPKYDFDSLFSEALDGQNVILGVVFNDVENSSSANVPKLSNFYQRKGGEPASRDTLKKATRDWHSWRGYTGNLTQFRDSASGSGNVAPIVDPDGLIRRLDILSSFRGELYVAMIPQLLRFKEDSVAPKTLVLVGVDGLDDENIAFNPREDEPVGLRVGEWTIPFTKGIAYLNFPKRKPDGSSPFRYLSAAELFVEGRRFKDLKGSIALIGSSSPRLNDIRATPLVSTMPGVELHATMLANILNNDVLYRPNYAWFYEATILIVMGLLLSIFYPIMGPMMSLGVTVATLIIIPIVANHLWVENGTIYKIAPLLIMVSILFLWNLTLGFLIEWRSKRRVEGILGQYLPPSLARQMSKSGKSFSMEGEDKELSILFSDVRGFTSISEKFQPQELTRFMNQMLTSLSQEIHKHNGTIDKYIGDAVMAFWGAPLEDAEHARNSVLAAIDMQAAIKKLSDKLEAQGYPELQMGVGICSGQARVGNMGSSIRLNYTVMGDTVNTASRLEGITKKFQVPILVSDRTKNLIAPGEILFREVDTVVVKGKQQPVVIYEPVGVRGKISADAVQRLDMFHEALNLYKNQDFAKAYEILQELHSSLPSEDGLVEIYLHRIYDLLTNPPDSDWEPITKLDTK